MDTAAQSSRQARSTNNPQPDEARGWSNAVWVELARRFANRVDLLEVYKRVRQRCGTGTDEPATTVRSDRPDDYNPRRRLLSERFTDEQVLEIVNAYRSGMKQREVVTHYGISAHALKDLLRKHRARRCDA